MEKLIYALQARVAAEPAAIASRLQALGASAIRINVRDDAVAAGSGLTQSRGAGLPDIILQFWLPSSQSSLRTAVERELSDTSDIMAAWLVCESTILEKRGGVKRGARSPGFAQIALLTLPDSLAWRDWRRIWRDEHTSVAVETQATHEYRQNLVVENLADTGARGGDEIVAIVEECFPIEALSDPLTFFGAAGQPEKFRQNLDRMMTSCARFITPGTIDVFATSQYDFENRR